MKTNYIKYMMLTLVASFTLALTSCGGGGFNPEKAKALCEKYYSACTSVDYADAINFTDSDAKALFGQYKAASEELLKLIKKY